MGCRKDDGTTTFGRVFGAVDAVPALQRSAYGGLGRCCSERLIGNGEATSSALRSPRTALELSKSRNPLHGGDNDRISPRAPAAFSPPTRTHSVQDIILRDKTGCNADMPLPVRNTPTHAVTRTTHQNLNATAAGPRDVHSVIGFHRQSQAENNVSGSRRGSPARKSSPRAPLQLPSWMHNLDPATSLFSPRTQLSPRSREGSPSVAHRRNLEDNCAAVFKFDPLAAIDAHQNRTHSPARKGSPRTTAGKSVLRDSERSPSPGGKPSGAPTQDIVLGPGVAPKVLNLRRNAALSRSSRNIRQALAPETLEDELRYRTREAAVSRHKATNGTNRWR